MSLVFFDFDNTLTKVDTTLPFASFLAFQSRKRPQYAILLWMYFLARLHVVSNHFLKRSFAGLFLRHETDEGLGRLAGQFLEKCLACIENRQVVDILHRHAAEGDDVFLVSANFDFFLQALCRVWPVSGVIATRPDMRQGVFTGRLLEKTCHGVEKLKRLKAFFGEGKVKNAIAYGDSKADLCLLEYVRQGYLVRTAGESKKSALFLKNCALILGWKSFLKRQDDAQCRTTISPLSAGR